MPRACVTFRRGLWNLKRILLTDSRHLIVSSESSCATSVHVRVKGIVLSLRYYHCCCVSYFAVWVFPCPQQRLASRETVPSMRLVWEPWNPLKRKPFSKRTACPLPSSKKANRLVRKVCSLKLGEGKNAQVPTLTSLRLIQGLVHSPWVDAYPVFTWQKLQHSHPLRLLVSISFVLFRGDTADHFCGWRGNSRFRSIDTLALSLVNYATRRTLQRFSIFTQHVSPSRFYWKALNRTGNEPRSARLGGTHSTFCSSGVTTLEQTTLGWSNSEPLYTQHLWGNYVYNGTGMSGVLAESNSSAPHS